MDTVKKLCKKCRHYIDRKLFYPKPESRDGLESLCKECKNKVKREKKIANRIIPKICCMRCAYSKAYMFGLGDEDPTMMYCRRRAPVLKGKDKLETAFPKVPPRYWCGEFKPKEKE